MLLSEGSDAPQKLLSPDSELQQEVCTWQTREDPFGGIPDEAARQRLRELLIERFAPARACHRLSQSMVAAMQRTPVKLMAVFS